MKLRNLLYTIVVFLAVGGQMLFAQVTGLDYQLRYDTELCRYDAYIIINSGTATTSQQRAQFNAQYTIIVPTGTVLGDIVDHMPLQGNFSPGSGTNPLDWTITTALFAPAADPASDYYSITPTLSPTSRYNVLNPMDEIKIFSFTASPINECGQGIRIFENGVDPDSSADGFGGADFSNGFTVGTLNPLYQGNLPTVVPPAPVLSAVAGCASGLEIDLDAGTSSCQTPLTYSWSGPGGFTSTDEDIAINPATSANDGTYAVTVTDNLGCTSTLEIEAISKPDAGLDGTACSDSSFDLDAVDPLTGTWSADPSNGAGGSLTGTGSMVTVDFDATASGVYNYIYTSGSCADTVIVSVLSQDAGPTPSAVGCFSTGTASLAGVGTGTWSVDPSSDGTATIAAPGNANTTVTAFSQPGTYILSWTESGCTDNVTIIVNDECDCAIANNSLIPPSPATFCGTSGVVALDGNTAAPAAGTYLWEYAVGGGSFTAAPGVNNTEDYNTQDLGIGTHSFRRLYDVSTGLACSDTSNIVSFLVNPEPGVPANIAATPNPLCLGQSTSVSVTNTPGATYTWTASDMDAGLGNSTTSSVSMTPTAVGVYDVFVTQTIDGCESSPALISITVNPTPNTPTAGDLSSTNPTACGVSDGTISLTGQTPNAALVITYDFGGLPQSVNATANSSGNIQLTGLAAGTYTNLVVSTPAGCSSGVFNGPISLVEPDAPDAPEGIELSDNPVCEGTLVTITVFNTPGATYNWTASSPDVGLGISTDSMNTIQATAPGQYTISVTQTIDGCESLPASIGVQIDGVPQDPTAATVGSTNPTACGTGTGTITLSGYAASTTLTVTYNLNGSPQSFSQQTSGTGVFTIPNLTEGTYSDFQVSNFAGCTSGVYPGPVSLSDPGAPDAPENLMATPNPICIGESVNLSVTNNPGATYTWSANSADAGLVTSTANSTSMTPTLAGTYNISVSQSIAGCASVSATVEVVVLETPSEILPGDVTSTNPTLCGSLDGTISIAGLQATTSYTVDYVLAGVPQMVALTSDAAGTVVITGLAQGSYSNFQVTNAGNCSSPVFAGPVVLEDPNSPDAPQDLAVDPNPVCQGEDVTVSVTETSGATYTWLVTPTTGGSISGTSSSEVFTPEAAGSFTISVSQNIAGCESPVATTTLFVNPNPTALTPGNFTGNNPSICTGSDGSIVVSGLVESVAYFLNYDSLGIAVTNNIITDAAGSHTIINLASGNYSNFELINTAGCSTGVFAGPVSLSDPGAPDAPANLTATPNPICLGESSTLTVEGEAGAEFTWSADDAAAGLSTGTGSTLTMTPTAVGSYTISVFQSLAGCVSGTSSIVVEVSDIPPTPDMSTVSFTDPTACGVNDGTISFDGLEANSTYTINYVVDGATGTASVTTDADGLATVEGLALGEYGDFVIINSSGCASGIYAGPVVLTGPPAPAAPTGLMGVPNPVCLSGVVNLSVDDNPNAEYIWTASNPAAGLGTSTTSTNTMTATTEGTYTISVRQTINGCSSPAASIDVVVNLLPPTPTAATVMGTNPSACLATDGFITMSGLLPNTVYTVDFNLNGDPVSADITADAAGVIFISDLGAGTYADFSIITVEGCPSGVFAGPIFLSEPNAPDAPSIVEESGLPACLGELTSLNAMGEAGATFTWSIADPNANLVPTGSTATVQPWIPGTYVVNVTQTVSGCTSAPASVEVYYEDNCVNPDFGVTYVGIELPGDLNTNDAAPDLTYSNVVPSGSNPDDCVPVVSANGTYTFLCETIGEYEYTVDACAPNQATDIYCISVPLVITVLDSAIMAQNPPVINHDYVSIGEGTPVVIEIYDNDQCQSIPDCVLGAPTIVDAPDFGTFDVNTLTYTPNAGYTGLDSFQYEACQDPATPQSCDIEWVYIDIFPSFVSLYVSAMDDYNQTVVNTTLEVSAADGLLSNDIVSGGLTKNVQTVGTYSVPGKGSVVFADDGSYVFTPVQDFVGPVDFVYTLCGDSFGMNCENATLHILVSPGLPTGSINSIVWFDQDGDGRYEANSEVGIAMVEVVLYDTDFQEVDRTETDMAGFYSFTDVNPGEYFVEFETPDGLEITIANIGDELNDSDVDNTFGIGTTDLFAIDAGQDIQFIKAGYYQCARIGDNVWYDVNENDVFDDFENGINGLEVELWRNTGGVFELWETTFTGKKPGSPSDDGWYEFCTLPGTYYIRITLPPSGLVLARPFRGSDSFRDSDINGANGPGTSPTFTVAAGGSKLDLGAGYYPEAQVGNLVWIDENLDGVQNSFEARLPDVMVEAYDANTEEYLGSDVTDENGLYRIGKLEKREVYFKFYPPDGMIATEAGNGDDAEDSDVDNSFGENTTRAISLNPQDNIANIDFGVAFGILPVTWLDIDVVANGEGHLLTWRVADQINVQEYIVERLVEGSNRFETISADKIGVQDAAIANYQYTDRQPAVGVENYYRVKQVDIDGRYSYSDIVSIVGDKTTESVTLYPNPTTGKFEIAVNIDANEAVNVQVFDAQGRRAFVQNYNATGTAANVLPVDITILETGVYTVLVTVGNMVSRKMLVKVD